MVLIWKSINIIFFFSKNCSDLLWKELFRDQKWLLHIQGWRPEFKCFETEYFLNFSLEVFTILYLIHFNNCQPNQQEQVRKYFALYSMEDFFWIWGYSLRLKPTSVFLQAWLRTEGNVPKSNWNSRLPLGNHNRVKYFPISHLNLFTYTFKFVIISGIILIQILSAWNCRS